MIGLQQNYFPIIRKFIGEVYLDAETSSLMNMEMLTLNKFSVSSRNICPN